MRSVLPGLPRRFTGLDRRTLVVRAVQAVLVLAACILLAAPWAVLSARTEANFGPHEASYELTAEGVIDVDLGPLGRILIPTDDALPLGLGVRAVVAEIPEEAGVQAGSVDDLGGDVAAYATFFAAPEAQVQVVVRGLVTDVVRRDLVAALGLAVLVGAWALARPRTTPEGTAAEAAPGSADTAFASLSAPRVLAGSVCLVLLVTVLAPPVPSPEVEPDPVFAGTPIAGAQITGRFSGVVDQVAALVADYNEESREFYAAAESSLAAQASGFDTDHVLVPGTDPLVPRVDMTPEDATVTALFASDIHCQVGMSPLLGDTARMVGADLYVDAGDITMTGTSAEDYCTDAVDHELPTGLEKVFVKGNHDSADTARHASELGWTVLDSGRTRVAGLTFYGAPDPRRTVFGSGVRLETEETSDEFSARLAREACGIRPDVLLLHDPRLAAPAMDSGCVPFELSGHQHRRLGPEPAGKGARFVNSTTGGALADSLTPGPLKMPAEFSVVRFDERSGEALDVQTVTVDTDAEVTVGPRVAVPDPGPWAPEVFPDPDADGGE